MPQHEAARSCAQRAVSQRGGNLSALIKVRPPILRASILPDVIELRTVDSALPVHRNLLDRFPLSTERRLWRVQTSSSG